MPASTKLATATYILSYVAVKAPALVTTATIAKAVKEHPARIRQLDAAGLVPWAGASAHWMCIKGGAITGRRITHAASAEAGD